MGLLQPEIPRSPEDSEDIPPYNPPPQSLSPVGCVSEKGVWSSPGLNQHLWKAPQLPELPGNMSQVGVEAAVSLPQHRHLLKHRGSASRLPEPVLF